jgi:hypothetical protein
LRKKLRLRVFENRFLMAIFGSKRDDVTGQWRKHHNEELNYLYSSTNMIQVRKPRGIRWVGHVAPMGSEEVYIGAWWGNLRERDYLEDTGIDGRIILKWIF